MIRAFNNQYKWLSNFSPVALRVNGLSFPTLEHAYQAYRATNEEDREKIRTALTPGQAKRIAHSVEQDPEFPARRVEIMTKLLEAKFRKPKLKAKLKATGKQELVEGNNWHDNFYGNCLCRPCATITGHNMLGKLLMKIRDEVE